MYIKKYGHVVIKRKRMHVVYIMKLSPCVQAMSMFM